MLILTFNGSVLGFASAVTMRADGKAALNQRKTRPNPHRSLPFRSRRLTSFY
jgi:hypothetical protein